MDYETLIPEVVEEPKERTAQEPNKRAKQRRKGRVVTTKFQVRNSEEYRAAAPVERALMLPKGFTLDLSKVLRLKLQGNNNTEIAKIMGLSPTVVSNALKPFEFLTDENSTSIKAYQENELEILDYIRLLSSTAIIEQLQDPVRRKNVDLMRLNNVFGTVFDKMRLIRGQSTSNVAALSKLVMDAHRKRGGEPEE